MEEKKEPKAELKEPKEEQVWSEDETGKPGEPEKAERILCQLCRK
jgi:hypothetical protein